ncbi:MAG: phosphoribosylglycinamide formyltransferase [Armatimonadetes bacterium]|nr:phosphoribosylglycinamide formyltransferase [Armatimonadota bacterium]
MEKQVPHPKSQIAVLVSGHGRGSNFQAIVEAVESGPGPAHVRLLVSANAECGAVERAGSHGIETLVLSPKQFDSELAFDEAIAEAIASRGIELVCLAGYMRKLTPEFIRQFRNRIMNIHPALLPAFGGQGMYGLRVHEAVIESGAKFSGATVHFVDEEYDHGPIIAQAIVSVADDDTPQTLADRVLRAEHRIYPEAIALFAKGRLSVNGRRVRVNP